MRPGRWLCRFAALGLVGATAAVALAAIPGGLRPMPAVPVILAGSGSMTLFNDNANPLTVGTIEPDGTCLNAGVLATHSPPGMFTIGALGSAGVALACQPSATFGIRRCPQHVRSPMNELLSTFTVLCITSSSTTLVGPASVELADAPINGVGATTAITIANPAGNPAISHVSIQLGEQDRNFEIVAPCQDPGAGCDAQVGIPPGGSISLMARCTPKSLGAHTAPLYVVTDLGARTPAPVMLACSGTAGTGGGPVLDIDSRDVEISQHVNAGPAVSTVQLTNNGDTALSITSITRSGSLDWTFMSSPPCSTGVCTLQPAETFAISVSFDPSAIADRMAALQITSNAPMSPALIDLLGHGQGATIALDTGLGTPPALNLGSVPIGATTSATFELRNDGNILLDLVDLEVSQAGSVFGLTTTSPTDIPASGTRDINVTCTPTAAQLFTGTIEVAAPEAISGGPFSIEVRCAGTTGNLYATPAAIQLGEIRIGSEAAERMIELKTVDAPLMITASPALSPMPPGLLVTAPDSAAITTTAPSLFELGITPEEDADLTSAIGVSASYDSAMYGGTGIDTIEIPITGKVVTPGVAVPELIDVGSFCVGQSTMPTTGELAATGTAKIHLPTKPVLSKMAGSPFQLTYTAPVNYPYELLAGDSAMVTITAVRQMTAGLQTDEIVWATDAPGMEAPISTVTAEFLADGGAITPQLVDFGAVELRASAGTRLVRIQNCGTAPIDLGAPVIEPRGEFRDESPQPLPAALLPLQVATLELGFSPERAGTRLATLIIDSSKGPLRVNLLGQGLGQDPGAEIRSFYGCSCSAPGTPAHGWPIALALIAIMRRRR